jgi:hypothetical protein
MSVSIGATAVLTVRLLESREGGGCSENLRRNAVQLHALAEVSHLKACGRCCSSMSHSDSIKATLSHFHLD